MRAWVTLPDFAGCAHYRAIYPGEAARDEGVEIEYRTSVRLTQSICTDGSVHVTAIDEPELPDVIVISRPLSRTNMESILFFQAAGTAVVVDIDDDFDAVDSRHQGWRGYQAKHSPESNRVYLKRACAAADLVTCTTPALAKRYAPHGRVAVLPNRVPKNMLGTVPAHPRDGRTVGWGGFVGTHPGDLQAAAGGVAMAIADTGARFRNVGTGWKVRENLGLREEDEFEATGSVEFTDYPHEIASFDVGIAPLADSMFNRAKSALKGLEMAAVGVPFVASAVPDYERIAADGIGIVVPPKSKHWRRELKALLTNERHREEVALRARDAVLARHVYEGSGHLWVEAWEGALANRRARLAMRA